MSSSNESTARKLGGEETRRRPEIIPWPKMDEYLSAEESERPSRVRLERNHLYYKGRAIPILHFKKAGYEKLLRLLVREITD
jgi:hypothetical protein